METKTLKWLDINDLKILKQIIIISAGQNGEYELGQIIYTRPYTTQYNLKKNEEKDITANNANRLLHEYPKQKNYPNDRIDEMIFDSIKQTFPKSILRNNTIFSTLDQEKLSLLKKKKIIRSAIYFSPEFSENENVFDYVGKTFKAPKIGINIYSYFKSNLLEGRIFYANFNVIEEVVLEKINTVTFE